MTQQRVDTAQCPLCQAKDETLIWCDEQCRVILVEDSAYPGFCRVICQEHVAEMSDLSVGQRQHLLAVVMAVEMALRKLMKPTKINLASLGNIVPHLHWHVIPRFNNDAHFPEAIWSAPKRPGGQRTAPHINDIKKEIASALK